MAQHVDVIMSKLHMYVNTQLNTLSQNSPLIALTRPLISRAINNNAYKLEIILKQISDKNGLVDIDSILSEMIDNIVNTKPFKIDTKFLGELEIGGGNIKMNLPFVNKSLVLSKQDLNHLKEMLNGQEMLN